MAATDKEMRGKKDRGHPGEVTELLPQACCVPRASLDGSKRVPNGISIKNIQHRMFQLFLYLKMKKKVCFMTVSFQITKKTRRNGRDSQLYAGKMVLPFPHLLGKDN